MKCLRLTSLISSKPDTQLSFVAINNHRRELMSWLFKTGSTLKGLIQERTENWERTTDTCVVRTTCLAHCYRGGRFTGLLWCVWEQQVTRNGIQELVKRWI